MFDILLNEFFFSNVVSLKSVLRFKATEPVEENVKTNKQAISPSFLKVRVKPP